MRKLSFIFILLSLMMAASGCLEGPKENWGGDLPPYNYPEAPYDYSNEPGGWPTETIERDTCILRWPGQFYARAKARCAEDNPVQSIRDFDSALYAEHYEVADWEQLRVALQHGSNSKFISATQDITIPQTIEVAGNVSIHGPGKLIFFNGDLKAVDPAVSDGCDIYPEPNRRESFALHQSIRIVAATDGLNVRATNGVHLVVEGEVQGQQSLPSYPSVVVLYNGKYDLWNRYNSSTSISQHVIINSEVKGKLSDSTHRRILAVNSKLTADGDRIPTYRPCADAETGRLSSIIDNTRGCGFWSFATRKWNKCGATE